MKTPRKPFKWKGRAWLHVHAMKLPMPWRFLLEQMDEAPSRRSVEVTIREVGKRGKK